MSQELQRLLDQTKSQIFLSKASGFFGSLLCSLDFCWDTSIETAATDGVHLWWAPKFFQELPPKVRVTVLRHELEHVARLHMLRKGERQGNVWNQACDFVINDALHEEDFDFGDTPHLYDPKYHGWCEEDVYDDLMTNPTKLPEIPEDIKFTEGTKARPQQVINAVVRAHQAGKGVGYSSQALDAVLERFLNPVVPWQQLLQAYLEARVSEERSWARPNRRYPHIYLPSPTTDDTALETLVAYMDTSGSVTPAQLDRFNSELHFLHTQFSIESLTIVCFDTDIRKVIEISQDVPYTSLVISGRGGTSLDCVHADILQRKPTLAIIFSDLFCDPMPSVPSHTDVLWAVLGSAPAPDFGQTIHISE
jgi:predicted metal-dependent peptidase